MKTFVVIGLGRFGSAVATELCSLGHEVLALDTDAEKIQKLAEFALREDNGSEPLKRKKVQKSPLFSPAGSDPFGEFPSFRAPFPGLQRLELRPSLLAPIRRADMHQNAPLRQLHRPPGRLDQPKHVRFPRFSHPGSS